MDLLMNFRLFGGQIHITELELELLDFVLKFPSVAQSWKAKPSAFLSLMMNHIVEKTKVLYIVSKILYMVTGK